MINWNPKYSYKIDLRHNFRDRYKVLLLVRSLQDADQLPSIIMATYGQCDDGMHKAFHEDDNDRWHFHTTCGCGCACSYSKDFKYLGSKGEINEDSIEGWFLLGDSDSF